MSKQKSWTLSGEWLQRVLDIMDCLGDANYSYYDYDLDEVRDPTAGTKRVTKFFAIRVEVEKRYRVRASEFIKKTIEGKIISDCCEALIGAIFIEKGFIFTEKFILKVWNDLIKSSNITQIDAKTKLQEYSLKNYKTLPMYKLISNTGPRHKPSFKVAVKLKNTKFVEATGSSKKIAEQSAAKELLNLLV